MIVGRMNVHDLLLTADHMDEAGHGGDYKGAGAARSKQADQKIRVSLSRERAIQIAVELRIIAKMRIDQQNRKIAEAKFVEDQLLQAGPPS